MKAQKVGIFSGTFDPIHKGHITFALEAVRQAGLDKVYFLPDRIPHRKTGVTHYAHRVAMIKLALKPHQQLEVLSLPDKQFSVKRTLPKFAAKFGSSQLFLLLGSDTLEYISEWPDSQILLDTMTLLTAVRNDTDTEAVTARLAALQPAGVVIEAPHAFASSRDIRSALMRGKSHTALLKSLQAYIKQHWLYTSLEALPNNS